MLKIIYYLKSEKENQYGECPIYAKINIGKKATTISTGKTIKQERWIETNRLRSLLRNNREKVIKEYLELFLLKAERFYNEEYKMGNIITLDELKSHLKGIEPVSEATYLIDLFNFHNSHFLKLVQINERSKASYQKYERSKELIQIFIKKKYGVNDIDVKEVSSSFIYNLESFLKFESIYKGVVGIQNNSVVKYFKNFKTVCNYAMKLPVPITVTCITLIAKSILILSVFLGSWILKTPILKSLMVCAKKKDVQITATHLRLITAL